MIAICLVITTHFLTIFRISGGQYLWQLAVRGVCPGAERTATTEAAQVGNQRSEYLCNLSMISWIILW